MKAIGSASVPGRAGLSVEHDLTGVGLVDAGEHFDQRRLARPILTEQSVNLSAADVKVDMIERKRPGETLDETRHREERRWRRPRDQRHQCDSRAIIRERSIARARQVRAGGSRRTA